MAALGESMTLVRVDTIPRKVYTSVYDLFYATRPNLFIYLICELLTSFCNIYTLISHTIAQLDTFLQCAPFTFRTRECKIFFRPRKPFPIAVCSPVFFFSNNILAKFS